MQKTFLMVFAFAAGLAAWVFDTWNLQKYLEDNTLTYSFEFPPVDAQDYILWLWLIVASVCSAVFVYYLLPRVRISNLMLESSVKFGEWYGVEVRRIGLDCECTAQAKVRWDRQRTDSIRLALRTRNQWEQQEQREEEIAPFNLRQTPKFLPIFIFKNKAEVPFLQGLDQTEAQWRNLEQNTYRVDISVSHHSLWASKKRIYIDCDGRNVAQINWFQYQLRKKKPREQLSQDSITAEILWPDMKTEKNGHAE
jgi:hypothetical protein